MKRYRWGHYRDLMVEDADGDYIAFTDHEAAIKKAVEDEREACAILAEDYAHHSSYGLKHKHIAAVIRSRGEKESNDEG